MGSMVQKVAQVVIVPAIIGFDTTNALPGTLVFDNATGNAYVVRLTAGVRSLQQIGLGGTPATNTRAMTVADVDGAPASGLVTYTATVVDGNAVPVQGAVVNIGVVRSLGVGALTLGIAVGDTVWMLDSGGDTFGICAQTAATGQVVLTVLGTPADEIDVQFGVDAPNGGTFFSDPGHALP